jgi:hypothetical protein
MGWSTRALLCFEIFAQKDAEHNIIVVKNQYYTKKRNVKGLVCPKTKCLLRWESPLLCILGEDLQSIVLERAGLPRAQQDPEPRMGGANPRHRIPDSRSAGGSVDPHTILVTTS